MLSIDQSKGQMVAPSAYPESTGQGWAPGGPPPHSVAAARRALPKPRCPPQWTLHLVASPGTNDRDNFGSDVLSSVNILVTCWRVSTPDQERKQYVLPKIEAAHAPADDTPEQTDLPAERPRPERAGSPDGLGLGEEGQSAQRTA
jgi:hypothetical protein